MNGRDLPLGSLSATQRDIGDVNARRAIDMPADGPLLAITGRAASGKTETLARRYVALLARDPGLTADATIVTAAGAAAAAALAGRIEELLPAPRQAVPDAAKRYIGVTLDRFAFAILAEHATLSGLAYDLTRIDAYDAQEIFERAIAPLFSADWSDFLGPDVDPEIPGLRAPDRFASAVLRLIRKLRGAQISPEDFLTAALRGATAFYSNPPNLCAPALLLATKDEHRGALAVDASELDRQRRRELDLAKIIAKIYRSYVNELVTQGCLTSADAIAEATRLLDEHPALARSYRRRFRIALVDDAHDLSPGAFGLLAAVFGKTLRGVTVAGDPDAATHTFAGARPERVFGAAAATVHLQSNYRVPDQIGAVVRALLDPPHAPPIPAGDGLRLHRAPTARDEAAFVADRVALEIAGGTPPSRVAVLHRSLRTLGAFEDALVDRDIAVALHGDAALFSRHEALDALGLLWTTVDPFAHGWLLRVLQLPLLAVSDATLATLCGEPASPQAALFDLPPAQTSDGGRRWDRRRDLRLGTNVVRGDRDADLPPDVRERLTAFRSRRAGWQHILRTADVAQAAAAIVFDGGIYAPQASETPARARRRAALVTAVLDTIGRYAARHPSEDLAAALSYCERIARGENGPLLGDESTDAVVVAGIDAVKGRRFEHVFVVDVRAGSFPPYYVPDAFLFSPTYGMIPKDSVGEAVTARTAKFTWYDHVARLRDSYSREDRRALTVALARSDTRVTVSACGRATRGVAAPELLSELERLVPAAVSASTPGPVPVERECYVERPLEIAMPLEPPPAVSVTAPTIVAAERLAEMLHCVRCAPRRMIAAAFEASFTLLSGRLPATDERIAERDVRYAFPLGKMIVFGSVPALVRHAEHIYVAVAQTNAPSAALSIAGLRERVTDDGFFIETADGIFTGPHPVAVAEMIERAANVLRGSYQPLCGEHRL